jgi:transcriptional regulator with XRE-family HTH domain
LQLECIPSIFWAVASDTVLPSPLSEAHAKGLSQDDLAYEAEVSRSYLSQLEKGAFYASLRIVDRIASVLDVEPGELLKPAKKTR